jgi:proline iminopeptidase
MKRLPGIIVKALACLTAVVVVFSLVLYLTTIGNYPVPKTVADDPLLPRITINGTVFHAQTFGNPAHPVVIVVHGGPGWDYRGLLPLKDLSDEYYVVFYDQRGTGLSPRVDPRELSLESSLRDLDSIIDYFGRGKRVDLIGHSWGAMLATAYLGKHPEKVSHAVLAEPGFLTTEMMKQSGVKFGPRWEAGFLMRATRAWFQSLHVKGPDKDAASDYFMGRVGPYANPDYYCGGVVPDAGALHWRAGVQAMQAILRSGMDEKGDFHINLTEGIERFSSPVLFLSTECNRLIGRSHQEKQAKFFPNAQVAVIGGSGHSMFGEKPKESISVVREYLKSR